VTPQRKPAKMSVTLFVQTACRRSTSDGHEERTPHRRRPRIGRSGCCVVPTVLSGRWLFGRWRKVELPDGLVRTIGEPVHRCAMVRQAPELFRDANSHPVNHAGPAKRRRWSPWSIRPTAVRTIRPFPHPGSPRAGRRGQSVRVCGVESDCVQRSVWTRLQRCEWE
jgi:hypothetical protein